MRKMKKIVMIALVGALILTAGIVSAAQLDIWGRVESVDTDANTITAWNGQLGEFTIKVDGDTEISIDDTKGSLADIVIPSRLTGNVDKDTDGAYTGINLVFDSTNCPVDGTAGTLIGGRIVSIDVSNRTIEMYSGRLGAFTVKLSDDAELTENGNVIGIEDLEVNDMVRFTADQQDDGSYLASSGAVNDSNCGGRPGRKGGPGGSRGGKGGRGGCGGGCGN